MKLNLLSQKIQQKVVKAKAKVTYADSREVLRGKQSNFGMQKNATCRSS